MLPPSSSKYVLSKTLVTTYQVTLCHDPEDNSILCHSIPIFIFLMILEHMVILLLNHLIMYETNKILYP